MGMTTGRRSTTIRPEEVPWSGVLRARALGWACRTDRRLQEAAEAGSRPEAALAGSLRTRLREAVAARASTEELFEVVDDVHGQLEYLPKPSLPVGLRVFIRELFGPERDDRLVIAPAARASWPAAAKAGAEAFPVAVIPQRDLTNPLMWPLVGLQAATFPGWEDAEKLLNRTLGPALSFARAAAMLPGETIEAKLLWKRGWSEMASGGAREAAKPLAEALADGVLISARRAVPAESKGAAPSSAKPTAAGGSSVEADGTAGSADKGPVYGQLAEVHDEPASAGDILHAGWLHWYGYAMEKLLAFQDDGDGGFEAMNRLVNGVDDLLCRSLDVAAIHRFYASGGAKR